MKEKPYNAMGTQQSGSALALLKFGDRTFLLGTASCMTEYLFRDITDPYLLHVSSTPSPQVVTIKFVSDVAECLLVGHTVAHHGEPLGREYNKQRGPTPECLYSARI